MYVSISCKLYLFNDLQVNIVMKNNILSLKDFMINIKINCVLIKNCRVIIPINVRQHEQFLRKKLFIGENNIILSCFKIMIFFAPAFLPNNCNFMFHLAAQVNLILYTYFVNYTTIKILLKSIFNCLLYIL